MLKGFKLTVTDEGGKMIFCNETADKITIYGTGKVNISMEELTEICDIAKKHLLSDKVKKN